jgi:hypothetical protein
VNDSLTGYAVSCYILQSAYSKWIGSEKDLVLERYVIFPRGASITLEHHVEMVGCC